MNFKDHFSAHAQHYAKYRPHYPQELFEHLAAVTPAHERAWDCATGNGQAAHGLTPFFARIIATDPSESQIENATGHEKITYRVATADKTDIEPGSIDLVTVAQALHWFDLDGFYREVKRVLKPGGVLAVWCYNLLEVSPEIDRQIGNFYENIVGPYWAPERELVEDGYRSLAFPFRELAPPRVSMEARWSLPDLLGYLRTWSATQEFTKARGADPVVKIADDLLASWGAPETRKTVKWPLEIRIGDVPLR